MKEIIWGDNLLFWSFVSTNDACKDGKVSAIEFKIKSFAGEIQILLAITTDCKNLLGVCFHQVMEFWQTATSPSSLTFRVHPASVNPDPISNSSQLKAATGQLF